MEEPKKKKTIHIGYVIAIIIPILIIVLVVVLWPSGEGGVTPTPTSGPTSTATPQGSVTPTATTPPVGSVTVSIDCPETIDKSKGRYFHALVEITSVTDLDAAQYDITYDPDVLRIQEVTAGDISGTTIPIEEWGYVPANTQGTVRIVNSVPNAPGVSGDGYLADIYFKVMGDPGDSSVISFIEGFGEPAGYLMIGNNVGLEISAAWTDISVTIE
jgi:Cohesin domain